MRTRLLVAGATLLAVAVPTAVAAPSAAAAPKTEAVGGPLMSGRGVIARVLTGGPKPPANVSAKCWLVADLDTGEVLAARDPHGRYLPASTIKTLTALALIPVLDPRKVVRPTFETLDIERGSSRVGLQEGEAYTVSQLFTAMLVASGNDASNALAQAVGGTPNATKLMNKVARNLQAKDTFAANAHGLDAPGQLTSCYDLALIGRAGLKLPDFRKYTGIRKSTLPVKAEPGKKRGSFEIYTHNKLFTNNYPGAIGGKSGYTNAARATFVGFAQRGNRRLVVTIMKADPAYYSDLRTLLDWGFKAAGKVAPIGHLVPPLDEIQPAAAPVATPAPGKSAKPSPAASATGSALPQAQPARPQPTPTTVSGASKDDGRVLGVKLRWWYAVPPLVIIPGIIAALIARNRRRRRRGFYMPSTKLRLPVR
jgi:D-alanyl-D-alanine carboxypeptidase (penicillin-binding protein 5/6)